MLGGGVSVCVNLRSFLIDHKTRINKLNLKSSLFILNFKLVKSH